MKKFPAITMLVFLVLSSSCFAENKKTFGRKNILIGADPAIMKLMSAVASNVDAKNVSAKPDVKLQYANKALKQFCLGSTAKYPDVIATTREMTADEFKRCQNFQVGSVIKFKIGYEALVVAANKKFIDLNLNERKLFQAIASDVPDEKRKLNGVLTINPYKTWKDIDKDAPKQAIKIYGPADKSRTERSVKMLGMEPGCRTWDWVPQMKDIQKSYRLYRQLCLVPRKDGLYIKSVSTDTDLTKQLLSDKKSIGLIDFNSWQKSKDKLKAYSINDMPPTIGTISKGLYPLSRTYYVYMKMSSIQKVQGLAHFMKELLSDDALAANGYLASMGMIPMQDKVRKREVTQASEFVSMTAPDPS